MPKEKEEEGKVGTVVEELSKVEVVVAEVLSSVSVLSTKLAAVVVAIELVFKVDEVEFDVCRTNWSSWFTASIVVFSV